MLRKPKGNASDVFPVLKELPEIQIKNPYGRK